MSANADNTEITEDRVPSAILLHYFELDKKYCSTAGKFLLQTTENGSIRYKFCSSYLTSMTATQQQGNPSLVLGILVPGYINILTLGTHLTSAPR